jgi:hypothetical protein
MAGMRILQEQKSAKERHDCPQNVKVDKMVLGFIRSPKNSLLTLAPPADKRKSLTKFAERGYCGLHCDLWLLLEHIYN